MSNIQNASASQSLSEQRMKRQDIIEMIKMERLYLYNRGLPCGAKKVINRLKEYGVEKPPSVSWVNKVLHENYLTNGRIGYYREDYC